MSKLTPLCVAATIGLSISVAAQAGIINVPTDQPTIQAGIDAASDGDEVVVAPDTYNELINFNGKAITLRSSDGADVTTIDGTGLFDSVVKCISGEGVDTVLEGFTITGGQAFDGGDQLLARRTRLVLRLDLSRDIRTYTAVASEGSVRAKNWLAVCSIISERAVRGSNQINEISKCSTGLQIGPVGCPFCVVGILQKTQLGPCFADRDLGPMCGHLG